MTDLEKTTAFTGVMNALISDLRLSDEEAAALLGAYAVAAMLRAFGEIGAARQCYLLSLQLAKAGGLDDLPSTAKH
jgi:hypothetical protein